MFISLKKKVKEEGMRELRTRQEGWMSLATFT